MEDMIHIRVQFFANLREIVGLKEFSLNVPRKISIYELILTIDELFALKGLLLEELIDTLNGQLKKYVKIIIDGAILFPDHALDTLIEMNGTLISFFPPLGGG